MKLEAHLPEVRILRFEADLHEARKLWPLNEAKIARIWMLNLLLKASELLDFIKAIF